MKYTYDFEERIFVVEEEEIIALNQVNAWFEAFEDIADDLQREDICLPFDEVIVEDKEFLEEMVLKTNRKCNITNKYVSRIALKEFMDIQYP